MGAHESARKKGARKKRTSTCSQDSSWLGMAKIESTALLRLVLAAAKAGFFTYEEPDAKMSGP